MIPGEQMQLQAATRLTPVACSKPCGLRFSTCSVCTGLDHETEKVVRLIDMCFQDHFVYQVCLRLRLGGKQKSLTLLLTTPFLQQIAWCSLRACKVAMPSAALAILSVCALPGRPPSREPLRSGTAWRTTSNPHTPS